MPCLHQSTTSTGSSVLRSASKPVLTSDSAQQFERLSVLTEPATSQQGFVSSLNQSRAQPAPYPQIQALQTQLERRKSQLLPSPVRLKVCIQPSLNTAERYPNHGWPSSPPATFSQEQRRCRRYCRIRISAGKQANSTLSKPFETLESIRNHFRN